LLDVRSGRRRAVTSARSSSALNILAADIGGTHARFAACVVEAGFRVRQGLTFRLATRQPGVASFKAFWEAFRAAAPADLAATEAFDGVALAVAGSVDGGRALLPNIDWDIRPGDLQALGPVQLVNDFVAQGYALAAGSESLEAVRSGPELQGAIALVGAGTGLGHCALHPRTPCGPDELPWTVAGSEAGHAAFAFQGAREKAIEERLLRLCGKPWISNDDVVSGPGAARLHEALSGLAVSPAEALAPSNTETTTWFARFYGRACRNFCLNVFPVRRLVISGGLAARYPHLVYAPAFCEEFDDAGDYRALLQRIPVWLNTDQDAGIRGAAVFAASRWHRPASARR
jgi:glucokinase